MRALARSHSIPDELAKQCIENNFDVLICAEDAMLRELVRRGQGRILMTGSVVSTAPNPFQAVYAATKAFVMSFGEALRYELKDTGVTVTVLQPGATETNFFERADLMDTKVGQSEKDDPALVAKNVFKAMMDGKDSVLGGGFKSKVEGLLNEVLPETVKAAQAGKATKPGSGKQSS
ncbi:hypothetical protein BH11MYX2_BH11MYX2_02810 [soil metagenome]